MYFSNLFFEILTARPIYKRPSKPLSCIKESAVLRLTLRKSATSCLVINVSSMFISPCFLYFYFVLKPSLLTAHFSPTTTLPILGSVAAGTGTHADDDIIGYEEIPSNWVNSNEQYVILQVDGDSMYPEFQDGDKVLVRVQSSVDSGDYGIVLIDGDSAVIKKVVYGDDWVELVSVNPMYPPRRFENEDVLNVRVFGLVRKSWRSYSSLNPSHFR